MKFFLISLLAAALVVCARLVATASLTVNVVDPGSCGCECEEEECDCGCHVEEEPPATVTLVITKLPGGTGTGDPFSGTWQLDLGNLVMAGFCPVEGGSYEPGCYVWGGAFTVVGSGPDSCLVWLQVACCPSTNNYFLQMYYIPTIGGFDCSPSESFYYGDGFDDEYSCDPFTALFELTVTGGLKACVGCDIQLGWVGNYQIELQVP